MLSDVKAALTEEYKAQLESGFNTSEVDGYSGFIFKSAEEQKIRHGQFYMVMPYIII